MSAAQRDAHGKQGRCVGDLLDEAAADTVAQSVKDSGLAEDDAIGVLVLNHKGEVKVDKVGKRSTGKGADRAGSGAVHPVGLAGLMAVGPRRPSPKGSA
jgi:hypothetical protein